MAVLNLGKVKPGTLLYLPFHTFDSNDPSDSVIISAFALADIKIFKDGGTTERASTSGFTLLDTDGINFSGETGIHGVSIDLADNTTDDFYENGSTFWVVIGPITVDAATTVTFVLAWFQIGYEGSLLDTVITTRNSATEFVLQEGSADASPYIGCPVYIHDQASAVQMEIGICSAYAVTTRTLTLAEDPGIFTTVAGDNISIMPPSSVSAGGITAASIATDAIDADALAADAVDQIRDGLLPTQNAAFNNIEFLFVAASDHVTPVTGAGTMAVTRSIDGGAFGAGTGTGPAEVGNGIYQYDASAADMNGGIITFRFTATSGTPGAPDDSFLTIITGGGV